MDPFSILAGVSSLLQDLDQLRARMNPEAELLMLMNSVSKLPVLIISLSDFLPVNRSASHASDCP